MRRAAFLSGLALVALLVLFLAAPAHAYGADVGAPGAQVLAQLQAPVPTLLPDAPAAEVAAPEPLGLLARGGPAASVAVLVLALVHLLRTVGGTLWPWLTTDRGGALLSLLLGVATALVGAASAGVPFTPLNVLAVVLLGVNGSWLASGAHSQVRRLTGRSRAQAAPAEAARAA